MTEGGRKYAVVTATSIVEGVLPGSRGRLFYPQKEIRNSVRGWDGIPITLYHPQDEFGNHVSGRSKHAKRIGVLRNSKYNGKLQHECWFDLESTKKADPRVFNAVVQGTPMELSTGLHTDNEQTPGSHNGSAYEAVARNYRPDHLAILPDQRGACSVQDGCGLNVNAQTSNAWTDEARAAALAARRASAKAHSATDSVQGGMDSQGHSYAARAHFQASTAHWAAWKALTDAHVPKEVSDGYYKAAAAHNEMSERHEKKAANPRQPPPYGVRFSSKGDSPPSDRSRTRVSDDRGTHNMWTDAAREASAAARKANAKSESSSFSDHAVKTYKAADASKKAGETGSKEDHEAAYKAHSEAAAAHDKMSRRGEADAQMAHLAAYKAHDAAADEHYHAAARVRFDGEQKGTVNMERTTLWAKLGQLLGITTATVNAKKERCPECGSDEYEDGECEACGYVENQQGRGNHGLESRVEHANTQSAAAYAASSFANDDASHNDAATAHQSAAVAHQAAAREAANPRATRGEQDFMVSGMHGMRAKYHMEEAEKHRGQITANEGFDSDDQREAFFGKLKGGSLGGGKGGDAARASDKANEKSVSANKGSRASGHEKAAELHRAAAKAHFDASKDKGDKEQSEGHRKAAVEHNTKAKAHEEKAMAATRNKDFTSDDERKAAFAHMADDGGGESRDAKAASDKAEKSGKASDHKAAAEAHRGAAEHHRNEGNTEMAAAHSNAARSHSQKAGRATANELRTQLLTNCKCDSDKQAINAMSDDFIVANAPNFSGKSAAPKQKFKPGAGYEDSPLPETDDDDPDDNTENAEQQWLAKAPPRIRAVVQNAMESERQQKLDMVRKLVVNVKDKAERYEIGNDLLSKSSGELKRMLRLMGHGPALYNGAGHTSVYNEGDEPTDNATSDDVLDTPVMNWNPKEDAV